MTEEQIIKASECCSMQSYPACKECPYHDNYSNGNCINLKNADIKDLINRKDEQIESLIAGQETLQKYIAEKDKEIEKLKKRHRLNLLEQLDIAEKIKSEAVKEFAEKFLKKIYENHYLLSDKHNSTDKGMFTIGIEQAVKETKKEMVGEG